MGFSSSGKSIKLTVLKIISSNLINPNNGHHHSVEYIFKLYKQNNLNMFKQKKKEEEC